MKSFLTQNLAKIIVIGAFVAIGVGVFTWYQSRRLVDATGKLTLKGRLVYGLPNSIKRELVENNKLPDTLISVNDGLKKFFSDVEVQKVFVERYKNPIIAPIVGHGDRMTPEKKQLLEEHENDYMTKAKKRVIPADVVTNLLRELSEKYALTIYQSNAFVMSSPLWDDFVVKIAKHRWIDNNEMVAFPYQLISRIFYNKKIRDFIAREKFNYVMVPRKYLYHIPGTPDELNDDNYLVIEEKIEQISDQATSTELRKIMNPDVIKVLEELKKLWLNGDDSKTILLLTKLEKEFTLPPYFVELIRVIRFAGIWSMRGHGKLNIAILSDGRVVVNDGRMAIVDVERPGLGGGLSRWEYFFHKNEQEVIKLAGCGLGELIELIE